MQGLIRLKQRDADGLFCWRRRRIVLERDDEEEEEATNNGNWRLALSPAVQLDDPDEAGMSSALENGGGGADDRVELSLRGARCARAYTFNGSGFDVVWARGTVWSLLAENSQTCSEWVSAINSAILQMNGNNEREDTQAEDQGDCDHSTVVSGSRLHSTILSGSTESPVGVTPRTQRSSASLFTLRAAMDEADAIESEVRPSRTGGGEIESIPAIASAVGGVLVADSGAGKLRSKFHLAADGVTLHPPPPPASKTDHDEVKSLRSQCSRLHAALRTAESNCYELETALHEVRREGAKQLECSLRQASLDYAADVDKIREGHTFELNRLKASWESEQQRSTRATEDLRGRIGQLEVALSAADDRVRTLETKLQESLSEMKLVKSRHQSEVDILEKSKASLEMELSARISNGAESAHELAGALRQKHANEMSALVTKMDLETASAREEAKQEAEARAAAAFERKMVSLIATHSAEIAALKQKAEATAARRKAAQSEEWERVNGDLAHLRELHAKRVKELEGLLEEERETLKASRREVASLEAARYADGLEYQRWKSEYDRTTKEQLSEVRSIRTELALAEQNVQSSSAKENKARKELQRVLNSRRLEKAEDLETKRQAEDLLVDVKEAQRGMRNADRELRRARQELSICQQELAFSERERLKGLAVQEDMAANIIKLTKLVYGGSSRAPEMLTESLGQAAMKKQSATLIKQRAKARRQGTCAVCSPTRS